jgi:DNA polymerase-3 subunit epsilon
MSEIEFTAFDFETATYNRMPCQLGVVVVQEGKIVEEREFLIRPPENRYDSGCINIHGITPEDTEFCPEFDDLWREIQLYFQGKIIVAHNLKFDIDVLNRVLYYYDLPDSDHLGETCTYEIFGKKLDVVMASLGKSFSGHHDALCDARACAEIYLAYLNGVNPSELNYPPEISKKKLFNWEDQIIRHDTKIKDLSIVENKNTIFYDKKIVVSGVFEKFPVRDELGLLLKSYGADINSTISSKTNIFILGKKIGPSKMKKALDLVDMGVDIRIMEENELYEILNSIK